MQRAALWFGVLLATVLAATQPRADSAPVGSPPGAPLPEKEVREYLEDRFGSDWSRYDLVSMRWSNRPPPPGATLVRITSTGRPTRSGSLMLFVELETGSGYPARVPIAAVVRPWVEVPVATRALRRGQDLIGDDFRMEERPLSDLRGSPPAELDPKRRHRTRRPVAAGDPLTATAVEEPPLVASGDQVVIRFSAGSLRISAIGIARRQGILGDVIPVENVDSRKTVLATVIDDGMVEVSP